MRRPGMAWNFPLGRELGREHEVVNQMEIALITSGLALANQAISALKNLGGMIPDENEKERVSGELQKAQQDLKLGEAQMAHGMGYKICKCTFPPQICLSIGRPNGFEQSQCPKCSLLHPPNLPAQPTHNKTNFF